MLLLLKIKYEFCFSNFKVDFRKLKNLILLYDVNLLHKINRILIDLIFNILLKV